MKDKASLDHDPDKFAANFNQRERSEMDLINGLGRQEAHKKLIAEYIQNEEKKIGEQLFQCRFKDQTSTHKYQLAIDRITNRPQTIQANLAVSLIETLLLNVDPGFDIEEFLDYQLKEAKGTIKLFLDTMGSLIEFGLSVWNNTGIVPPTSKGKRLEAWIQLKRSKIHEVPAQPPILTNEKIVTLHTSFVNTIWSEIEVEDFIAWFKGTFKPNGKILINQNLFVYLLSQIDEPTLPTKVTAKLAKERFGIRRYDQLKSKVLKNKNTKILLKKQIRDILKDTKCNFGYQVTNRILTVYFIIVPNFKCN